MIGLDAVEWPLTVRLHTADSFLLLEFVIVTAESADRRMVAAVLVHEYRRVLFDGDDPLVG